MATLDGSEQVLCVPAQRLDAIGLYQGFRAIAPADATGVLSLALARAEFRPRTEALEHGPEGLLWLQVIPYTVLVARGPAWETPSLRGPEAATVFAFRRPATGGDPRLAGKGSIGIGGHVNPVAGMGKLMAPGRPLEWNLASWAVRQELIREVFDEAGLALGGNVEPQLLGLVYDGRNDVGQRHLGIVCAAVVDPAAVVPNRAEVEPIGWLTPATLASLRPAAMWESWSALLVDRLDGVLTLLAAPAA